MKKAALKIGTRGSKLALVQAHWVQEQLRAAGHNTRLVIIRTQGDQNQRASLARIGGEGVFVKEIEHALLANEIDIAVHSLKDLPCDMPEELTIAAVPERIDPRDVLCSRKGEILDDLAGGASVGTSSPRRRAQILAVRADLRTVEVRGNLDTRLRKLAEGKFDALVMAAAGMIRMGWQAQITQYFSFDICLPAPGQGALALQTRKDNAAVIALLSKLDHTHSRVAVEAERALLSALGGGCAAPIGAIGVVQEEMLILRGVVASLDGRRVLREKVSTPLTEPYRAGVELAERLYALGAEEILASISSAPMLGEAE